MSELPVFNSGLAKKLCSDQLSLSKKISLYLEVNPTINEESITDILVTEWRILDKRFNFCNIYKHSRRAEARSGVDIELELWIIKNGQAVTFAFQAKKLVKDFNQYKSMFCYPNRTKEQINKLIEYSKKQNQIPAYLLYGHHSFQYPENSFQSRKNVLPSPCSIFIKDAYSINSEFIENRICKLSRDEILAKSKPFHDLFCLKKLPMNKAAWHMLLRELFLDRNIKDVTIKKLPAHVKELLNTKTITEIPSHLNKVKYLAALNLDD